MVLIVHNNKRGLRMCRIPFKKKTCTCKQTNKTLIQLDSERFATMLLSAQLAANDDDDDDVNNTVAAAGT